MDLALKKIWSQSSCRGSEDPRLWALDDATLQTLPPDIQIMCDRCPVQGPCLDYALDHEEDDGEAGVWGGTAPYQRRQLKRKLARVRCPGCQSEAVVPTQRGEMCISCGISWLA